ncbi:MAG: hypothetical protein MHM6MM_008083 [Cercozoa sp. M6MM]
MPPQARLQLASIQPQDEYQWQEAPKVRTATARPIRQDQYYNDYNSDTDSGSCYESSSSSGTDSEYSSEDQDAKWRRVPQQYTRAYFNSDSDSSSNSSSESERESEVLDTDIEKRTRGSRKKSRKCDSAEDFFFSKPCRCKKRRRAKVG